MEINNKSKVAQKLSQYHLIQKQLLLYLRYWKWFLLSLIIMFFLGYLKARYATKLYGITSSIQVKEDAKDYALLDQISTFDKKNNIEDEIEILKARTVIKKVINDNAFNIKYELLGRVSSIDLYKNSPITIFLADKNIKQNYKLEVNIVSELKYKSSIDNFSREHIFGAILNTPIGDVVVKKSENINNYLNTNIVIRINSLESATSDYTSRLSISSIGKKSNIILFNFLDPIEEKGIDFLNSLVLYYNDESIAEKNLITLKTQELINERLEVLGKEIATEGNKVDAFKTENNFFDIEKNTYHNLNILSEYQKDIVEYETNIDIVNYVKEYLTKSKADDLFPETLLPNNYNGLSDVNSLNKLAVERRKLLNSNNEDSPLIVQINEQISNIKKNIINSLNLYLASEKTKISEAKKNENIYSNIINKAPSQEKTMNNLLRNQKVTDELYLYLLQKREETYLTLANATQKAKIINPAYSVGIKMPQKLLLISYFLIAGFLIPLFIIFLIHFFDDKIHNKNQLKDMFEIPYLGDIPFTKDISNLLSINDRSSTAEAIRIIKTNINFIINQIEDTTRAKTILFTSTIPKEGKTFCSVNIATSIAHSDKKVLLIGLDIRNPKLDNYFDLPEVGFTNFIANKDKKIDDYIVKAKNIENLYVLPPGIIPPNPAEVLIHNKVESMFDYLKTQYDYIILDTAPLSLVTDTYLISKYADTCIYVIRANYLQKGMLEVLEDVNENNKMPRISLILNRTTNNTKGYGYGYGYGYSYGYGVEVVEESWFKKIIGFFKK